MERLYQAVAAVRSPHTQADLARLLDETSQQIWAWEQRGVSRRGALKAQDQLGINAQWLLENKGAMLVRAPEAVAPESSADAERKLREALALAGHATAAQMQSVTGLSDQLIRAAGNALLHRGEALAAAGTQPAYVVPRSIPEITSTGTIPVFQIDAAGRPREFATLVPTSRGRYWIEERAGTNLLHDGLPWFLQDMRPQGFLGRAFAQSYPELKLPTHPDQWTDEQVLRALALNGDDLPGNLVVGERSFQRFIERGRRPSPPCSPADYPRLAIGAMLGAAPGSSAGGEQPKFACVREDGVHVLVKFSPPADTAVGQRWSDLLVCEHLALQQLAASGIPAARSRIRQAEGRTFLEVERFDRTPRGRVGMVSLRAYDCEYVGQMDNWAATAERMQRQKLITAEDGQRLRFLEVFGEMIANTDRHYGNVSLLIDEHGDWALAPAYDQLPMLYAPIAGEILEREAGPAPDVTGLTLSVWDSAMDAGRAFWDAAAHHELISDSFRNTAALHARTLAQMQHGESEPAADARGPKMPARIG